MINEFRFYTKGRELNRKIQNIGVVVIAQTESYSISRDFRLISEDVEYFGVVNEICELAYMES